MKTIQLWIGLCSLGLCMATYGQQSAGGISPAMLQEIQKSYEGNAADKAIQNAISNNDINKLAVSRENKNNFDTHFSHRVHSKGITNQKSSGRCWLFTGQNVLRAKVIAKYNLKDFQLSHSYPFFSGTNWKKPISFYRGLWIPGKNRWRIKRWNGYSRIR